MTQSSRHHCSTIPDLEAAWLNPVVQSVVTALTVLSVSYIEPFRNVSRCFLHFWSWLESASCRDVSAFQHRKHLLIYISVARFILALSQSLLNFPVAGSKQDQLKLEGINRFECARDRHPFCSSTRFRKLAPLLQAVTRVTKVGFWKCRRVHQNWTSKCDSPSYEREMILLINWAEQNRSRLCCWHLLIL